MPRSIMTPNGLIFIQDLNIDNDPLINTSVTNNGRMFIADMHNTPRTLIRTQPSYSDVNNDPDLRKRMVKYYYGKIEVWLYGAFKDLGSYVVEKNGEASLGKGDVSMTPAKARYLMEKIIRKSVVLTILDKFVRRRNVNWFDLKEKHHSDLKEYIYTKLKSHFRRVVD